MQYLPILQNIEQNPLKETVKINDKETPLLLALQQIMNAATDALPEHLKQKVINKALDARQLAARPKWSDNISRKKFQDTVRMYVNGLPPHLQISELNAIQSKCPFVILDPKGKRKSITKMKYGYADLYRFLGHPYGEGIVRSSMQGQNPFYNPIVMPIPDVYGNHVLARMRQLAPDHKLMTAKKMFEELSKQTGGAFQVNENVLVARKHKKKVTGITKLLNEAITKSYSPVTLSHFVPGQERPMKKYWDSRGFKQMIANLNKVHLIKPVKKTPTVTKAEIKQNAVEKEFDKLMDA